jgi:hypothetical protein
MFYTMQPEAPRLLDQVRLALRRKYSLLRREDAYVGWIKRSILFHEKQHPCEMGESDVEAFGPCASSIFIRLECGTGKAMQCTGF